MSMCHYQKLFSYRVYYPKDVYKIEEDYIGKV